MKKRDDRFDRDLKKIYEIGDMLKKEGKTDGERRQFEFMAMLLLFIDFSLRRFCSVVFILLGFVMNGYEVYGAVELAGYKFQGLYDNYTADFCCAGRIWSHSQRRQIGRND